MESNKKHCQKCGAEITDAKAKKCTECGAKISKPIFKKWWFWVIIAFGIIIIGASGTTDTDVEDSTINNGAAETTTESSNNNGVATTTVDNKNTSAPNTTKYEIVDVQQMIDDLDQNALRAENTYKNKYVQITGKIANFDSSGSYITIEAVSADEWNFDTVMCYIKKDAQRDFLMEKSVGDVVTIKGKIISVGEVLGYSVNIDEIN